MDEDTTTHSATDAEEDGTPAAKRVDRRDLFRLGGVAAVAGAVAAASVAEFTGSRGSQGAQGPAGTVLIPTAVKTSEYAAVVGDFVPVDTTAGDVTVALPAAPPDESQIGVKHVARGATHVVSIACGGSDVFEKAGGSTSTTLTLVSESVILQYHRADAIWYVLAADGGSRVSKIGDTMTGELVVPGLSVSGLTGAKSGTRFAGATTSTAPASGTFAKGDFVVDQSGQLWICTIAGTPGTWAAPGSGRELGYAEITAVQSGITGVGIANRVAVAGLSIAVTVAAQPIKVIAHIGEAFNGTAGDGVGLGIFDTADLKTPLAQAMGSSIVSNASFTLHAEARKAPSAGAKTYAVYAWAIIAGSGSVSAGAQNPAFIQVVEL